MEEPFVSIIIASRDREKILLETLAIGCNIIKDRTSEIIVINDGDIPIEIPQDIVTQIHYFENAGRGASVARNYGVSKAKGDVLFFMDDDMWLNDEVLNWIINNKDIKNTVFNINWVYPPLLTDKLTKTKVGRYLLSAKYNTMWGRIGQNNTPPTHGLYKINNIGSGSLVISKEMFYRVGKYNESLIFQGEDADLSQRINKLLIPVYAVFDTTLYHNHADRIEITGFLKRISIGFHSEFKAEKEQKKFPKNTEKKYKGAKKILFDFFKVTEQGWILLLDCLPTNDLFTPLNNRIIGMLSGLQRYKQYRNINPSS